MEKKDIGISLLCNLFKSSHLLQYKRHNAQGVDIDVFHTYAKRTKNTVTSTVE